MRCPAALLAATLAAPLAYAQPRADAPVATAARPADPERELADAENSYLYGDYPRVVRKLTPLVEPDVLLVSATDQAQAYELLGLAHFFLDQRELARKYFERLIKFRPDYELNPVLVPPPVVAFYGELHETLADEIKRRRDELRRQEEAEQERRRLASTIVYERRLNSRFVASMPFGMGQFQNEDPGLGALFLGTELLATGLSFGFYLAVLDLRAEDGTFARGDVARAESLQQAQLVSGGIALALVLGGILEAHLAFDADDGLTEVRPGPVIGPQGLLWRF